MSKVWIVVSVVLLSCACVVGQTKQPHARTTKAPVIYQAGMLLNMVAHADTKTQEVMHTSMMDAPLVSQKVITYEYNIRVGSTHYTTRYKPDVQPRKMPEAWWKGNTLVHVRPQGKTLFIQLPDGSEIPSRIVKKETVSS